MPMTTTAKQRKATVIVPKKSTVRTSKSSITSSSSESDSADITSSSGSLTTATMKGKTTKSVATARSGGRKMTATARPHHEDFDAIYENTEEQKQQHHRAIFLHLISQV